MLQCSSSTFTLRKIAPSQQTEHNVMSDSCGPGFVRELLLRLRNCLCAPVRYVGTPDANIMQTAIDALEGARWDEQTSGQLDAVIRQAYEGMRLSPRSDPLAWRELYTDASILRSLADTLRLESTQDDALASSCISRLDHALVIAGAPGEGRLDIIYDAIHAVQQHAISRPMSSLTEDSFHGAEVASIGLSMSPASASHQVPRLTAPPSLSGFVQQNSRQPFVIPGYITDWPALNEHPWKSFAYLRSVSGPGRVVPVEIGDDYRDDDWTQKMMSWGDFLNALDPNKPSTSDKQKLYLAQHNLFLQFPKLRDDILIPDYAYASLHPPKDFPDYAPPANKDQLVLNVWLGPPHMTSPAHTDPYFNFYAQVVGHKTVWLAPPEVTPAMYAYTLPDDIPSDRTHNPAANTTNPCMSNTSRVNVFGEREKQTDLPMFWEEAVPRAMSVTLEPGDLLFFPPGWWHAMRSETTSFSVSMWF